MGKVYYLQSLVDKLDEAEFFLRKVESSDWPEAGYFTNAFASACYSLICCLKRTCAESPPTREWWNSVQVRLDESPTCVFFHKCRNDDTHEGFSLVIGLSMSSSLVGEELVWDQKPLLRTTQEYRPEDLAEECQKYFRFLVQIWMEGYGLFRETWDAGSSLSGWNAKWVREVTQLVPPK